jgi:hypothetical protein
MAYSSQIAILRRLQRWRVCFLSALSPMSRPNCAALEPSFVSPSGLRDEDHRRGSHIAGRHSDPVTRTDHTAVREHLYARLPGHLEASERETMDRRDSCHDRNLSAAVNLYTLPAMMPGHLSSRDSGIAR